MRLRCDRTRKGLSVCASHWIVLATVIPYVEWRKERGSGGIAGG
jgi:hypothetical protein